MPKQAQSCVIVGLAEAEIAVLVAAFGRVVARGTTELVLVSGYSGIGKSSVVNELHKALVPRVACSPRASSTSTSATFPMQRWRRPFRGWCGRFWARAMPRWARWRNALEEALGPNGQLIVNLIPELELIIGKQPPVADLPPQDAQRRFQMVFRRFLGVFARAEHPLALFLDDLQWLDAATLALIEDLATHPEVRYLLLIGAYRDNEVGPAHPLVRTLEAIRTSGVGVQQIVLSPLALRDVGRLVAEALRCERERAYPLAELVHAKTAGNPFFAIQFLSTLVEERLVAFDPASAAWRWDLGQIRAKGFTDNVVDLMVGKLKRLPDVTQEALQQLACLGNVAQSCHANPGAGAIGGGDSHGTLGGWSHRLDLSSKRFLHVPARSRAGGSLCADPRGGARGGPSSLSAELLASRTAPEEIEEKIFEIVNQLDRGAALLIERGGKRGSPSST